MSNIPEALKYNASHEWIKVEGDTGTIGITDHAQQELTDVVYVELPKMGLLVEKDTAVAVIESVKAASDIYAPVSGEIIAVNEAATTQPALVNQDPYGGGWLFKIKISKPAELASLMDAAAYRAQIGE